MKEIFRKIIFFSLFFSFLISTPLIFLYSQGMRIDFEKKKLTFTGAIYLKAIPKEAEVYLNGKFFKKTDSLFGNLKIENLIPKKYKILVKKEGYFDWEKELEVKEKKVLNLTQIVLIPKNLKFEKSKIKIEDFENLKTKKIACQNILKSFKESCFQEKIGDKIFLIVDKNLYSFFPEEEKIFEGVKGWERKDGKILIFLPHEIWLLENSKREFLIRETKEIKDLAFLNQNYFVFLSEKKLKIAELDNRDKLNVYEFEIDGERVAVNEKKEILILKGNEILISPPLF